MQCDREKSSSDNSSAFTFSHIPAVIPPKPSPSSLHSFPFFSLNPPLSSLRYSSDSHLSLPISPLISLESLFYFIGLIFSRCECHDSLAAVWVLASGLWRLRDPAGAYHASWAAEGEREENGRGVGGGAKKKSNLANLKLHSPTTEDSSSLCTLSLFFAFPSALFSIRKALFLNLLGGPRGQLWKRRRRGGIISPCHIFNLPYTHTHWTHTQAIHRHPHTAATIRCSPASPLSFSLLKLLLFLVIPGDALDELERALVGRFNLIFRCEA